MCNSFFEEKKISHLRFICICKVVMYHFPINSSVMTGVYFLQNVHHYVYESFKGLSYNLSFRVILLANQHQGWSWTIKRLTSVLLGSERDFPSYFSLQQYRSAFSFCLLIYVNSLPPVLHHCLFFLIFSDSLWGSLAFEVVLY